MPVATMRQARYGHPYAYLIVWLVISGRQHIDAKSSCNSQRQARRPIVFTTRQPHIVCTVRCLRYAFL